MAQRPSRSDGLYHNHKLEGRQRCPLAVPPGPTAKPSPRRRRWPLLTSLAVEFGGGSLLNLLTRRIPGYLDNPLRQNMWRAGHAHPGVWLVLGLVGMLYADQTPLSGG
jgi:hypothetical protein